jgi:hypothetical protein
LIVKGTSTPLVDLMVTGLGSALTILLVPESSANTWTRMFSPGFGGTIGKTPLIVPLLSAKLHGTTVLLAVSGLQLPPLLPVVALAGVKAGS